MRRLSAPAVAVIALGNRYRHDDGAGPVVAARAVEEGGLDAGPLTPADASDLVDGWDGCDLAIVVDATRSGAPAGTVRRTEFGEGAGAPGPVAASTHALGLAAALRLSRALGSGPRRVVVVGVEGADFGPGEGLSPAVAEAVPAAVAVVVELIREAQACAPAGFNG